MPYDFDLNALEESVESVVQEFMEPPAPVQDFDAQLSEAERRLEKAGYYKALLTEDIFSNDSSPAALSVAEEMRAYAKTRLAVLLGVAVDKPVAKSDFNPEEVKVLKQIASRLTKKPSLAEPPSLQKVDPPAKPSLKPVQTAPARQASRPQQPQPRQAPSAQPTKPAPAPRAPRTGGPGMTFTGNTKKVDGKEYKEATDPRGTVWVGANGQKYLIEMNDDGGEYLKNVTGSARSQRAKPIPSLTSDQMAMVSGQQARTIEQLADKELNGNLSIIKNSQGG